jgi:hypothetical protein
VVSKWAFSLDERAAGWFQDMIKVGVVSAKKNTSLTPICLFDGCGTPHIFQWLEGNGVQVVRARVPFYEELFSSTVLQANEGTPYQPSQASGAYLRLFASDYIKDDFFLYTDCDVMFLQDPAPNIIKPRLLAACKEFIITDGEIETVNSSFNSGVIIFNRNRFLEVREEVISMARHHNYYHRVHSSYDQSILNIALADKWEPLPAELNWRPFQGIYEQACILHFHGPKPTRISEIMSGKDAPESRLMARIIERYYPAYEYYVKIFNSFLSDANS